MPTTFRIVPMSELALQPPDPLDMLAEQLFVKAVGRWHEVETDLPEAHLSKHLRLRCPRTRRDWQHLRIIPTGVLGHYYVGAENIGHPLPPLPRREEGARHG